MSPVPLRSPESLVKTEVVKRAVVLGDGLGASIISLELADQGFDVDRLMPGNEPMDLALYAFPSELSRNVALVKMKSLSSTPRIRLHRDCTVSSVAGSAGDFEVSFTEAKSKGIIKGGAVVLAQDPGLAAVDLGPTVVSNSEMRRMIEGDETIPRVVVFIEGSGMTTACPAQGSTAFIENALEIKRKRTDIQIYVLTKDIHAPGAFERTYQAAQASGIVFFRGDFSYRSSQDEPNCMIIRDPVAGEVKIRPELIVRDEAFDLGSNSNLARKLGLSVDREGRILSINTRLHPGETIREGVFVCHGLGASILASDNISEACAIASSISELLSKDFLEHGAEVSFVDKEKCSACLACVRICPYDAPFIGEKGKAEIRIASCQGCGICVSLCPSKAIDQSNWTDAKMSAESEIASKGASG